MHYSMRAGLVKGWLMVVVILLVGCGGGGGSDDGEAADKALARPGIYVGEVTSPASESPPSVLLLLSPSGRSVVFADTTTLIKADLRFTNGRSATAPGKLFLTSGTTSGSGDVTVAAEFQTASDVTLNLRSKTSDDVVMTFKRANDSSDRGLAIADISKNFVLGSGSTEFRISANGALEGTDGSGCMFSGAITIPNRSINIFDIDFNADHCGGKVGPENDVRNGEFAGVGTYLPDDGTGTGDVLTFGVADTDIAAIFSGE